MYIEQIQCEKCKKKGWLEDFPESNRDFVQPELVLSCDCGHTIIVTDEQLIQDLIILSAWPLQRFGALSNHMEMGVVEVPLGGMSSVRFPQPFDHLANVMVYPSEVADFDRCRLPYVYRQSLTGFSVFVLNLNQDQTEQGKTGGTVTIKWNAMGSQGPLPDWFPYFYSATGYADQKLYKFALLEYAVAFEVFLDQFLQRCLTERYKDKALTEHLLKSSRSIEHRFKTFLELATGKNMYDRGAPLHAEWQGVYNAWKTKVQEPRNQRVAHGGNAVELDEAALVEANRAVYRAMRWLQGLVGIRNLFE